MRLLAHKNGDLSTSFNQQDKINKTREESVNTSLKPLLNNNHDVDSNKREIKGHLHLEHIFGYCKSSKKISKSWFRVEIGNINIGTKNSLH